MISPVPAQACDPPARRPVSRAVCTLIHSRLPRPAALPPPESAATQPPQQQTPPPILAARSVPSSLPSATASPFIHHVPPSIQHTHAFNERPTSTRLSQGVKYPQPKSRTRHER